jgi:pyruvate/2-oxoglutarate dehydrogenase complex dihydrolipoamide acyltransferase (E2) component
MTEIRVPTLGESVTEATIGRWFKKAGDAVAVDEPLVELETDKVTIEVPAPSAGVLGEITAKDGETVAVGALLGQISEGATGAKPAAAPAKAAAPAAPRLRLQRRRKSHRQMRRWRLRFANSRPKAASMPPLFPAPARMAG